MSSDTFSATQELSSWLITLITASDSILKAMDPDSCLGKAAAFKSIEGGDKSGRAYYAEGSSRPSSQP